MKSQSQKLECELIYVITFCLAFITYNLCVLRQFQYFTPFFRRVKRVPALFESIVTLFVDQSQAFQASTFFVYTHLYTSYYFSWVNRYLVKCIEISGFFCRTCLCYNTVLEDKLDQAQAKFIEFDFVVDLLNAPVRSCFIDQFDFIFVWPAETILSTCFAKFKVCLGGFWLRYRFRFWNRFWLWFYFRNFLFRFFFYDWLRFSCINWYLNFLYLNLWLSVLCALFTVINIYNQLFL